MLSLAGAGAGYGYWRLDSGLHGVDVDAVLDHRPPREGSDGAMNLLLMGSDTRKSGNDSYAGGAEETPRSDTTVLLHISADHRHATAVSIPRDTVVDRPECRKPGGGTVPASSKEPFNWAFAYGGATCTLAIVTDDALAGPRALGALAWDLRHIDPDRIRFRTPELEPDPGNPSACVRFGEDTADLWRSLREDSRT